jgi:hypothetical protein
MNPLVSLALAHPKQPPLHHLEGVGLQVDQDKQQPILRGTQWTVLVGRVSASGARLPIETQVGHVDLEGGLKGRDQALKLVQRETGQIQHLRGPGLDVGET